MEKLINQIPKLRNFGKDKNGNDIFAGFTLRYSFSRDKWVCGYGKKLTDKLFTEADDPVEALAFFVELLNSKKE
jgi:hypothetical protein